jgi:hypothetical protein
MSKLESLDGSQYQPMTPREADRVSGGAMTNIGRCHFNNEIQTDYTDDGWWTF